MTASELAVALGVHVTTIRRYESGDRRITEEFAEKVKKLAIQKQLEEQGVCSVYGEPDTTTKCETHTAKPVLRTKFYTPLNNMLEASSLLGAASTGLSNIDNSQYTDELSMLNDIRAQLQKVYSSIHAKQCEILKYIEGV